MGHDSLDAYSRELSLASEAYPASFKFGVPDQLEFFGDTLAEAAYQAAVQRLQDMGGTAVHRSRADDVYTQLKRDIAEFRLVPGDRFTETEISVRLGVSRTPVRQALFRLQQEGFVEVLFRSGWRVSRARNPEDLQRHVDPSAR